MMRRSGARPAVKRWKLSCEMLLRRASGHIEATQLSKLGAASRIAVAVIRGWPEAPSSPLQGSGPPAGGLGACAAPESGAEGADLLPLENRLSRKFSGPPPEDCAPDCAPDCAWVCCAWACPDSSNAAATAAVRQFAIRPVRSAM